MEKFKAIAALAVTILFLISLFIIIINEQLEVVQFKIIFSFVVGMLCGALRIK